MNEIIEIIIDIWRIMADMSVYLLFGFLVAGTLHVLFPQKFVEKHLAGTGIMKSVKAALIGVPMPLCSCGVIPVTASLRKHGAGRGATVSFLTSTPQTGVDSIMITYGMLGWIFAAFRIVTAFISGILCGTVVEILDSKDMELDKNNSLPNNSKKEYNNRIYEILHYGFINLPQDIARALILGLIIAGIMGALIPQNFFVVFTNNAFLSMIVMMLIGLPLYVCSTASVPVAAVFLQMGLSPGAVLVFLITGPATNAATITTISKIVSKKTAVIYLATIIVCSFIAGFILNTIDFSSIVFINHLHRQLIPIWLKNIGAIILLLILVNALLPRKQSQCSDKTKCNK